ncbi:transmembrane protein 71 [Arapaima gigas]
MTLLFSGPLTSSPIKDQDLLADQPAKNSSLLSPLWTLVKPPTASPASPSSSRRSPRLLSNGYYVLTADSFVADDEGNVSLSATQTNISYKENMVRVFSRRKRRPTRSLDLLFNLGKSCQSLMDTRVSTGERCSPFTAASWGQNTSQVGGSFTYAPSSPDETGVQSWLHEVEELFLLETEACFSQEQFSHSLGGFLDISPQPQGDPDKSPTRRTLLSGAEIFNVLFFILFLVCLFTAVSWWILQGLTGACIAFAVILTSVFLVMSALGPTTTWPKTEDITPRQE